jgi:hypothetical protein
MVAGALDPRRLLFVDECGTHTSLAPLYGYVPREARGRVFQYHATEVYEHDLLAGEHHSRGDGTYSIAVEGSTTAEVFEAYL